MSVPAAKTSTIEESPGTDSDRMTSTPSTPLSRSASNGTVINCSTSSADKPRASVWISAYGGVNSGSTSTDAWRSCTTPTDNTPSAIAKISRRNRSTPPKNEVMVPPRFVSRTPESYSLVAMPFSQAVAQKLHKLSGNVNPNFGHVSTNWL